MSMSLDRLNARLGEKTMKTMGKLLNLLSCLADVAFWVGIVIIVLFMVGFCLVMAGAFALSTLLATI